MGRFRLARSFSALLLNRSSSGVAKTDRTAWPLCGTALFLIPLLCVQACTTATSRFEAGSSYPTLVVEGIVGLTADPNTAQHLDSTEAQKLWAARVIPLRVLIHNVGVNPLIIESASIILELHDNRALRPIAPELISERLHPTQPVVVLERPTTSESAGQEVENPEDSRPSKVSEFFSKLGEGSLWAVGHAVGEPLVYGAFALAVVTSPIWGPPFRPKNATEIGTLSTPSTQ